MLVTLVIAVIAAALATARGGSLRSLAETQFAWVPLLVAALGLQLLANFLYLNSASTPGVRAGGTPVIVLTFLAVATFLFLNRRLPGMVLAAAGMALNLVVIAVNGAMPVSSWAADVAGAEITPSDTAIKHEIADETTILVPLGDTIPIPRTGYVISPGDVLLAAGIGVLVYSRTLNGARAPTRASG